MDACARIKGVPLKNRATIRKETVRENSALSLRSLLKNRKELSNVMPELHSRESQCLPEIHFVCLPSHAEGEDFTLQALTSLSAELMELLRSLHIHTLKDEEVLFLKDPKRPFERKDGVSQAGLSRAMCILRQGGSPQISTILGLLTRYTAGIRYALELQSLQRGISEACQAEDDDTNQSVSSIEEDFVTAFEHLEEEETECATFYSKRNQRDVASQTLPPHFKDLSGSRIIISSISKKSVNKEKSAAAVSGTKQKAPPSWSGGTEGPWSLSMPSSPPKACITSTSLTESDESDCSSPSPIIFLDEIGYQKSLKAKLDIPKIPVLKEGVEDSDSEVSEFFDSFDQFDDLDQHFESCVQMPKEQALFSQKKKQSDSSVSKYASKVGSTTVMNPHKFDHRTLPANVKKPTPLKPGSPYNIQSDAPDSPRPTRTSCEESGGLFSPVRSSAFSPLGEGGALECFWKVDGDGSELRKPQDLCSLYKTYSDFANNLSKEILGTVCGYSSPIDININKNLSCVCHKEFKNTNGHLMKLSDIQETVTIAKTQSQSLKDGIQKFATDLVEMSIGSALRDLQKGVSSCTTTLCHLAARLTSSVFQMAFQEIGMRHAYVLKERAINGLASFLVGEAVSGALKEFLFVKKQIFNNTVTRFASDLAEELIFESIMEVCQFSHPSTPLSPRDWSFDQEEEVVCSYASDLSESVLQEAFIELSQADVTFTTQAAISVSLDNICYVSAEDTSQTMKICNARSSYQEPRSHAQAGTQEEDGCTVKKALYCVSGMASCVPVPAAGKAISFLHNPEETCHYKSSISHTCQTSPKRSICSQGRAVTSTSDTATPSESVPSISKIHNACGHFGNTGTTSGKSATGKSFHNFSGAMVDTIVSEAFDIMTTSKMKKKVEDCADFLSKTIGCRMATSGSGVAAKSQDVACQSSAPYDLCFSQNIVSFVPKGGVTDSSSFCPPQPHLSFGSKNTDKAGCESVSRCIRPASKSTPEVHSTIIKDTLEVPSFEVSVRGSRKVVTEEVSSSNTGAKSSGTPGTPPSTPQQPSDISSEKQIKQFSKKLKGKLAKEFSPATPPPTPHYQPTPGLKDEGSESDKAEFMLKLMRSLSEEAVNNEDEDDDQEDGLDSGDHYAELTPSVGNRTIERGALHFAERLACHIVSMATEMDTVSFGDGVKKQGDDEGKGGVALHSAQFSEQTLNSLWTYAGEIAGEVISDVKRMMSSSHCRHKATKRGSSKADNRLGGDQKDCRLTNMTVQWSNDFLAPILNHQRSTSSGMSSEYPSCESVTDEYAGYVIKVLKKEGGSRELILDQYASRLAYRSIKSGLAHAARKIKQRSPLRLHSTRRLHHDGSHNVCRIPSSESSPSVLAQGKESPSSESMLCACQDGENMNRNEYMELVNFAESLAYNITCDVTRKLRMSSARLPKSLTDSCLYRKPNVEEMAENLIKTTFSCSLLPYTEKNRQYHSTGSLDDGNYNNGVMQVIEHYAKKIVDDTLEVTLGHTGHQIAEERRTLELNSFTEKLTEAYKACRYCQVRDCLFCSRDGRLKYQGFQKRMRQDCDGVAGLEIPKIHIDLDKRAVFAEEMVSAAIEKAKKELSSTSLNADSGIGHDGASFAESLTTEIMTSALSNVCQTINLSAPGRESVNVTESTVSQQLNLSVGDDSLGSWSNLSFEEDHPDESSSFHHLSDRCQNSLIRELQMSSNGNSSSWSSLGLEGEVYEEHLSFSPSDSDYTEEKETEAKNDLGGTVRVERGHAQADRALLVVSTDVWGQAPDPQLRAVLKWMAASIVELPFMQFSQQSERDLQQFLAVVQRLREREWRVGELLQALLRYYEEYPTEEEPGAVDARRVHRSLFQWLLEHA
ncbi:A-kinase anchor protein 11 isoform X3 [Pygocentrus nattereri]|uniref:A-kinase anchor protein 11 isoform X3 n=1 Tax=Pygocentrus nattereri TaxID=42514 RepID=UPI00081470C5|nr:A-kinase anchor protein 11 isoform X3 [Pygocentrus nattereri]